MSSFPASTAADPERPFDQSGHCATPSNEVHGWRGRPGVPIVRRDLATDPVPADAWATAVAAQFGEPGSRTPQQEAALALSGTLADEVFAAEAYILAAPLYNWGVSEHVKAWIDMLLLDSRFRSRQQPLAGRPATLIVTRGGGYGPGTPKEGWDHATPYLPANLRGPVGPGPAHVSTRSS